MKIARRSALSSSFLQLAVILFLLEMTRSAFLLSFLPAYAEQMSISVAMVGIAVSAHYVADTVIKVIAGYILDRLPARILLHCFLLVGGLGLCLSFFGSEPWTFIVGASLLGAGVSPVWLLVLSQVQENQRGSQMGSIYTVWFIALGLGPVAINFVIDQGNTIAFLLLAGFWCFGWLVASTWKVHYNAESMRQAVPWRKQLRDLRVKLTRMKPLVPGMVLQTAAAGLLLPVLPTFASKYLNLSYSNYSLLLVAGGIFTVIFLIPMGRLADRLGYKWFLIVGFALLSIALYLLLHTHRFYDTLVLAALLGFAYSIVLPAWNALMSTFVPSEQKATGWGVLSGIEGIGVMIGPVLGGWIASRFSEPATVGMSALLLLAIAVFYFVFPIRGHATWPADRN